MLLELIPYAFLIWIALMTFGYVDDEHTAQKNRIKLVLAIAATVLGVLAAVLSFSHVDLSQAVLAFGGFTIYVVLILIHMAAEGQTRIAVVGVCLGANPVRPGADDFGADDTASADGEDDDERLYSVVFEYEFNGEIYCVEAQDHLTRDHVTERFANGHRYRLWVDPENPWVCRCSSARRSVMVCIALGLVFDVLVWSTMGSPMELLHSGTSGII